MPANACLAFPIDYANQTVVAMLTTVYAILSYREGDDCRFTVPPVYVERARPLHPRDKGYDIRRGKVCLLSGALWAPMRDHCSLLNTPAPRILMYQLQH
jgi:hypothetical protein